MSEPREADPPASFATIERVHAQLDEVFLVHQELVLLDDLAMAAGVLAAFRELLGLHMEHEETLLLPLYAQGRDQRWPAELFLGQHEKMKRMLDRVVAHLEHAAARAGRARRQGVLALLERETAFKHLSEHHHLAEDQALFPVCDQVAEATERARVLAEIERTFAARRAVHQALEARALACLASAGASLGGG